MFALINIDHHMLNSLPKIKRYMPDVMKDCVGVSYQDEAGYVQAALKINLESNDSLEVLQNVLTSMGLDSVLYIVDDCVAMLVRKETDIPTVCGHWHKLVSTHQVPERTYFIEGSRYYVGAATV
jgi:hypothetical protein